MEGGSRDFDPEISIANLSLLLLLGLLLHLGLYLHLGKHTNGHDKHISLIKKHTSYRY